MRATADSIPRFGRPSPIPGRNHAALAVALALAAFLSVVPARPQEETEITEEMTRLCPGLATAEGRAREQLILLYFRLDPARAAEPDQQKTVREHFDLARAEDEALLRAELFDPPKVRCMGGLKAALAGLGAPGALLCIRAASADAPLRRARALEGLQASEFAEVYALLRRALGDKAFLDDADAQIAPPGFEPKRVADHAFRVLAAKLEGAVKVPKGLLSGAGVGPMVPVPDRDERIGALLEWSVRDPGYAAHVQSRPSLVGALPADQADAARAALQAAGVETDK